MIEQLTQHGAADQTAEEIAGKVGTTRDPSICLRRLSYESRGTCLRKEGADSNQGHPGEHVRKVR